MRILIALAALCAAGPAAAHSLWWTRVTHYTDGAEISVSDVVQYRVEWTDNGVEASNRTLTAASTMMPDPPAGTIRCYRVRAVVADEASEATPYWCRSSTGPVTSEPPPQARIPNAPTELGGN